MTPAVTLATPRTAFGRATVIGTHALATDDMFGACVPHAYLLHHQREWSSSTTQR